jgi:hypothetical protein
MTTEAGMYAPGAGAEQYALGIILMPSGAGGRSKNSRVDSPKKLRDEAKMKFFVLHPVV